MSYTIPKGVFDILPEDPDSQFSWRNSDRWEYVINTIHVLAKLYGFHQISTPIFEKTELFKRGVGSDTDIVNKEMYTFNDKAKRSMTLRPEGTAPVVRCFTEKKLHLQKHVHKLYYIGPMFRYERQQAGRYRQHHQFGAEVIGEKNPEQDVELIDFLYTLYSQLGLKNLTVFLNSVGNQTTRKKFGSALKNYLKPYLDQLSLDSQNRFKKNPLRILDSKDHADQKIVAGVPSILDFLEDGDKDHFKTVLSCLKSLKIPYSISDKLVRGLDYYNCTVFEVVSKEPGAQNTIGAGGRYDGLLNTLRGPDLPAVGFATGIERILQTMENQRVKFPDPHHPLLFLIPLGKEAVNTCFLLLKELRNNNIHAEMDFSQKKLKHVMRYADKIRTDFVIILGENEMQSGICKLKNMQTGISEEIHLNGLLSKLQQFPKKNNI